MNKRLVQATAAVALLCLPWRMTAQSRVFKEVSDEMSSQVRAIMQDESLMGYVVLTRLEKANADSFNYRLSIMDENLNDIGNYNFQETDLELQQVAFEQNVLCLAYLKNTFTRPKGKSKPPKTIANSALWLGKPQVAKEDYYKYDTKNIHSFLYSQFLDINGKLISTAELPVKPIYDEYSIYSNGFNGSLKNGLRITAIPERGFAYVYGDGPSEYPEAKQFGSFYLHKVKEKDGTSNERLLVYDLKGQQLRNTILPREKSAGLSVLNQEDHIYVLRKKIIDASDGGFELLTYHLSDTLFTRTERLSTPSGTDLKILSFKKSLDKDQPHLSGMVMNKKYTNVFTLPVKRLARPVYTGIFDIRLNQDSTNKQFSYWVDGSKKGVVSKKSYINSAKSHGYFNYAFDDFSGNTYYVGTGVHKRVKWVSIGISVITVLPLPILAVLGTQKVKFGNTVILQQTAGGQLKHYATLASNNSNFYPGRVPVYAAKDAVSKDFFSVHNEDSKNSYVVLDDKKDIFIYDINTQKTLKTIPHKAGEKHTSVYKAKSGHIMLSEYNRKDKSTRLSIESL